MNKNILLSILFLLLFIPLVIFMIVIINSNLPTIQFFINPTHKPTQAERSLLLKAGRNPSEAEFKDLYQHMLLLAKPTPYIEIGRCSPYPLFAKVYIYDFLKFKNSDKKLHIISLRTNRAITEGKGIINTTVTLLPGESKQQLMDFYSNVNVPFGYYCDNSEGPVGIVYLAE